MSKYDILFEKIITNEELAEMLGPDARRYKTIADAKKLVLNKRIQAIAEIVNEVGKKYEAKRSEAKVKLEEVTIDNAEFQAIYRKVVSLLTK